LATTIAGETYLGDELVNTLSQSGDVTVYLWPMRCLKAKIGGPTFGVDVKGVEVIRFDCHGELGHWHELGYDKLGAGGSHVDFPDGLKDSTGQIDWALGQIRDNGASLLDAAGYPDEAKTLDTELLKVATAGIKAHIASAGDLRAQAVEKGLIEV
jgi:hypothetical protein